MNLVCKNLMPLVVLAAAATVSYAADKDGKSKFTPPALDSIETKQMADGLTIGAISYNTESLAHTAFGKLNPYEYGVLPVLLIMRNDSKETLKLQDMKVEYIDNGRERIEATPAADVKYMRGPKRPSMTPSPIPGVSLGKKKNPLAAEEIESRAFTARMLPAGESAYGFVYFQTGHRPGSHVYITGLQLASSGKQLFYFDIPLD